MFKVNGLVLLPILFYSSSIYALEDSANLEECYEKSGSPFIQACMYNKEQEIKKAFQDARNAFLKAASENFSGEENGNVFPTIEQASNQLWQDSLDKQCSLQALFSGLKDSYAYTIEYGACRVKMYQERMSYLKALLK